LGRQVVSGGNLNDHAGGFWRAFKTALMIKKWECAGTPTHPLRA
jgi:hypothetical protein